MDHDCVIPAAFHATFKHLYGSDLYPPEGDRAILGSPVSPPPSHFSLRMHSS